MVTAVVYLLLLALWSAIASYIILFMMIPSMKKKEDHGHGHHPAPYVPKTAHYARETRDYSSHEGFKSFATKEELTVDDIVKGLTKKH